MPFTIRKDPLSPSPQPHQIVFDNFRVDLRSGEIRKNGSRIRLQAQPFRLLALLLENGGEVVTRDEICRELWPADTFVDFEHSLPAAVNKIREALGDSAENPRYIETLPKRGYRFIGKIKPDVPVEMPVAGQPHPVELVPVAEPKGDTRWKWVLGGIAATVLAAAVVLFLWLPRKPAHPAPDSQTDFQTMTAVPFTSYPGIETAPSFSPDGSRIAFSWDSGTENRSGRPAYDLYVKGIGSETLLRLTNHPSDWISSIWSPDGTQIAFHRLAADDNGIYVVPALGGPERKLLTTHTPYDLAAPLSWSPDGKWIAYSDPENGRPGNRNFLLNVDTLEAHELPHDPSCRHDGYPNFSHSGKELAVICVHNTSSFEYRITDLQGKPLRSLGTRHDFSYGLVWSGDDRSLIFPAFSALGRKLFDMRVSDGEVRTLPVSVGQWPTISNDGHKLAFSLTDSHINIWRKDLLHPQAPPVQMFTSTRPQNYGQYSPDGRHIVFDSMRSGTWSVWLADIDGSNLVQITHEGPSGYPRWSPDSRKIVFEMTEPSGLDEAYTVDISDRVPRKLKTNVQEVVYPFWSHDGKWIYFLAREGTGHQLYRCPAGGGDATLLVSTIDLTNGIESPDGKTLYFPWYFGDANMTTLALDRPGAKPQEVPQMPKILDEAQWAVVPNGIYFTPLDNPRTISFYDFATRRTREVFKVDKNLSDGMSISPDGRYMLYSQLDENNASIMLLNPFR